MLKKLFGASGASHELPALALGRKSVAMSYRLHQLRWHTDMRPHVSFLFVHDLGVTADASWSPLVSAMGTLPAQGMTPVQPLLLFTPDLRNHGQSPRADGNDILDYAEDVLKFARDVVHPAKPLHLVGVGLGARVAAVAALADSARFDSLALIDGGILAAGGWTPRIAFAESIKKPVPGPTPNAAFEALRSIVPDQDDRLSLLAATKRAADGSLEWQADAGHVLNAVGDVARWPTDELAGRSFSNPVVLLNTESTSPYFPNVKLQQGSAGKRTSLATQNAARSVALALLSQTELLGEVQQPASEEAEQ